MTVWQFSGMSLQGSFSSTLLESAGYFEVVHLGEDLYLAGSSDLGELPAAGKWRLTMMCHRLCCLMSYKPRRWMPSNTEHIGFGQRLCRMGNPETNK